MTTAEALDDLRSRVLSGYPILLLRTFEEQRWEAELSVLALELERGLVTWSVTSGPQPPSSASGGRAEPVLFLSEIEQYPSEHLFLLKDLHPHLQDARVVRKLRDMLPQLQSEQKTLLLMGPVDDVPLELSKDVTIVELPLPGIEELRQSLLNVMAERDAPVDLDVDARQEEHLLNSVLGLTAQEAEKAFARALQGREEINDEVYAALVAEKRHMVQGARLLEFFDLDEGIDDIGGLDGLKEWISQRSEAFSVDARERGIGNPKGVLLVGVQGCGKSLSAKAIARRLGFPLVRLDLATLLEETRGSSEQNLRDVLHVMETIAPSVLWMEEIDKAFAGFDDEAATTDATLSRILGRFLTWLQEHREPVFVVATANNVGRLPPELLRRGRFDELFFVDLPNYAERKAIFDIHLRRRGWKPDKFDIDDLAERTDGFSGAEIETIVNSAVIESYSQGRLLSQDDLLQSRDVTVPLSVTMEDQIFQLREWARSRCRPATLDSRLQQVMEEETRRGETDTADGAGLAPVHKWKQLADHGQVDAALIELVRLYESLPLNRLESEFSACMPTTGEYGLALKGNPKVVLWTRISKELVDLLTRFIEGKRLYLHPTGAEAYGSGRRLTLPVLDTLPEERATSPAWLPTTLRLIPSGRGPQLSRVTRIRMGRTT
ncbi:MAG: AAA family ATPase [Planctomycetaceae bacterium]|nr:AAA family ATPase [Planctomycetaceae bacterium]